MKTINRIRDGVPPDFMWYAILNKSEKASLKQLATSDRLKDRYLCIKYLRELWYKPKNHLFVLELADILIPDRSNHVRYAYLGIIDRLIIDKPELLWPIVTKWCSVKNRTIRLDVAFCLLEHIIDENFEEYFPKAREIIESGNKRFSYALAGCWTFNMNLKHARIFIKYQNKLREQFNLPPIDIEKHIKIMKGFAKRK